MCRLFRRWPNSSGLAAAQEIVATQSLRGSQARIRRATVSEYRHAQEAQSIEQQRWAEQQCLAIVYLAAGDRLNKYLMTPTFTRSNRRIRAAISADKRLRHPYVIKQSGMTRLNLGEDHFHAMNSERRLWIERNCSASVMYDQLPRGAGQRYLFESYYDAFGFMMQFGTRVVRPAVTR